MSAAMVSSSLAKCWAETPEQTYARWETEALPCVALIHKNEGGPANPANRHFVGDVCAVRPAVIGFGGKKETDGKFYKVVKLQPLTRGQAEALCSPEVDAETGEKTKDRRFSLPTTEPDDTIFDATVETINDKKLQKKVTAKQAEDSVKEQ